MRNGCRLQAVSAGLQLSSDTADRFIVYHDLQAISEDSFVAIPWQLRVERLARDGVALPASTVQLQILVNDGRMFGWRIERVPAH